jgi:AcrR family transcriptional regulator
MDGDPLHPPRLAEASPLPVDSHIVRKRDTRQQLILAAERLFAERGIDGVSLREINLAAKQRNTSAAHYHFGSKDALIDAIFEFRRAEIGRRRDALLDMVEESGRTDPRALAEALVLPMAMDLEDGTESGRYYLEFLAQLFVTSPLQAGDILRKHQQAATARWVTMATKTLPNIPARFLFNRSVLMGRHVVISMAAYLKGGWGIEAVGFDAYLNDMIDAVAAYVAAPVSEQTLTLHRARIDSVSVCKPKESASTVK